MAGHDDNRFEPRLAATVRGGCAAHRYLANSASWGFAVLRSFCFIELSALAFAFDIFFTMLLSASTAERACSTNVILQGSIAMEMS